jgi:hypothetical protein
MKNSSPMLYQVSLFIEFHLKVKEASELSVLNLSSNILEILKELTIGSTLQKDV